MNVRKLGTVTTEIRSFYSIKEIMDYLQEELDDYRSVADEYSQWLGSLLRDSDALKEYGPKLKDLNQLQKRKPQGKRKETKQAKSRKSPNWIRFKDIELSASEAGQAEILFQAIEEIAGKTDRIERVQKSIEELEKSGFGKDIIYVTYICDGIPKRIFLRHKKDGEFAEKFQFIADFSVVKGV